MKKLLVVLLAIAAFVLAAAFRFIQVRRPVRMATSVKIIQKPFLLRCYVGNDEEAGPVEIPALTGWGDHHWKITTTSDSAQFYFDQGINMYYAFHIVEARASFTKATRFDSSSAMAWYGRALSLGPNINFGNGYRPSDQALTAARKSADLSEACTPLEKDLIAAMGLRYSADTGYDLKALLVQYSDAMQKLADKHAGNADVISLYADALMVEHPWDLYDGKLQPKPWTSLIRQVLEKALAADPRHPGANHYMIHTLEGSLHPEEGLKSADMLAGLMPDVAHVVHMPSHIYIRTGHYKRGVRVNDSAVNGYYKYREAYGPVTEGVGLYQLHAIHMGAACSMMAGNFRRSLSNSDSLRAVISNDDMKTPGAVGSVMQYLYNTRLFVLVRFGKWEAVLKEKAPDTSFSYAKVLYHFARGMAFAHQSQLGSSSAELASMRAGMNVVGLKEPFDPFSSAYDASLVAEGILEGVIAFRKHDLAGARRALQRAVSAEDAIIYNEPRDWLLPARQYLGQLLVRTGDLRGAAVVFERDLQINPTNGWSLTGLRESYRGLHDDAGLRRVEKELKEAWQMRDMEVGSAVY